MTKDLPTDMTIPSSSATPERGTRGQFLFVTALTLSRAPLIALFMAGALWSLRYDAVWLRWFNLACLVLSSVTDLFDGMLARKWSVTSRFGAVCDPMLDKVFFIVVFPTLTAMLFHRCGALNLLGVAFRFGADTVQVTTDGALAHAVIMLVLTVTYIIRDQWVMALRALAAGGGADMKANMVGKVRTALSFPIGCLLYCHIAFGWSWLSTALMIAIESFAIMLNLYSFVAYTMRYKAAFVEDKPYVVA